MDEYLHEVLDCKVDGPWLDVIREATRRGREVNFEKESSKYVCHLSTMPFLNIADERLFKKPFKEISFLRHQEQSCPVDHCKHLTRDQAVKSICPCGGADLIPVCYMTTLREHMNLGEGDEIKGSEVMFCPDQCNILGEKYPGRMREATGVTGWRSVEDVETLISVLKMTSWGTHPVMKKTRTLEWIRRTEGRFEFDFVKKAVAQSIYLSNSILLMGILTNPAGLGSYENMAMRAACSFEENFYSFLKVRKFEDDGTELWRFHPVQTLKAFHAKVKETSRSQRSFMDRFEWTDVSSYLPESATTSWIAEIIAPIVMEAFDWSFSRGTDYTQSVEWILHTHVLSQGRAMSHLPMSMKLPKREQFRAAIARPPVRLTDQEKKTQFMLMTRALEEDPDLEPDKLLETDSVEFQSIEENTRTTSSVEVPTRQGGKLEMARLLLTRAVKKKWKVPIYDLYTGIIVETFIPTGEEGDHQRDLFWISLSIVRETLMDRGLWPTGPRVKWKGFKGHPKIFQAAIVHIDEQAKERNLVKASAILSWFYTPYAKTISRYLASSKTHKTGLTGTSDAWNLDKRISPFSEESGVVYNSDGTLNSALVGFELDLTESTDWAVRERAMMNMDALNRYSGFPRWYGRMVLICYQQPNEVTEVIYMDDNLRRSDAEPYSGKIREGCMMGLEPTKPILHSFHLVSHMLAKDILKRNKNCILRMEPPRKVEKDQITFPRNPEVSRR